MSYYVHGSNDSESERPRDFSLIDSSPDSMCSPLTPSLPPPPLPQPRTSKVRPMQETVRRVDGLCTKREPQQGPSNGPEFYREVVDKLKRYLERSKGPNIDGGLDPRRRRFEYSDENVLNQGGREALNSHYEKWTGDVTSRAAAKSATTGRRGPLHASIVPPPTRPTSRRNERKIKTVVKYVEYDSYGRKNESKYIIKMQSGATSLQDFKRAMPHCVRQPRFFFSIGANENVELEDDNAKLPTITSEEGEPIIVAEITSRPL